MRVCLTPYPNLKDRDCSLPPVTSGFHINQPRRPFHTTVATAACKRPIQVDAIPNHRNPLGYPSQTVLVKRLAVRCRPVPVRRTLRSAGEESVKKAPWSSPLGNVCQWYWNIATTPLELVRV